MQNSTARSGLKVLVTGAGGQVGLDLLRALQQRGDEVVASDLVPPAPEARLGLAWASLDLGCEIKLIR